MAASLTALPTPPAEKVVPESAHREEAATFVRWALAQLEIPVENGDRDATVLLPEGDRGAFAGQHRLRLPLAGGGAAGQESLAWDSRFGRWLRAQLDAAVAVHARPHAQPMTVGDVTAALFDAYQVENGRTHLAGCQLTDHAFLRLSFVGDGDEQVRHVFTAPDGSSVSDELVPRLGLDRLEPIAKAPRLEEAALRSLVAAGRRIAAKQSTARDPTATIVEPLAVAVVWVRHAEGRLQFTLGKATTALPFSSWARLLQAPAFVGRHSGASTFRLAATDDGRIDAAEEIAVCQESGRRMLRQELVECSVTGKRVSADFTERCPATGAPALRHEFATCTACRQRVSKAALDEGRCIACRSLTKATKDDPRLQWIFGEHPGLDRWNRWQLAETETAYVAQASKLFKRLLVVVDKESLAVRRVATAGIRGGAWVDADETTRDDLLK